MKGKGKRKGKGGERGKGERDTSCLGKVSFWEQRNAAVVVRVLGGKRRKRKI